ncbi:hypothetical protein GOODEAATRI_030048 [Goodea atripinnis]|uniref:Uncharacterized protein n=1 Tax=Goodea atripinnis TaxID=208336 RepID=A0ABV0P8Z0_9TELE
MDLVSFGSEIYSTTIFPFIVYQQDLVSDPDERFLSHCNKILSRYVSADANLNDKRHKSKSKCTNLIIDFKLKLHQTKCWSGTYSRHHTTPLTLQGQRFTAWFRV